MTSRLLPSVMETQLWHLLQGEPSGLRFSQLSAFARIRAVVVLPVPQGGGDVALADDVVEGLRPVFAVERLILQVGPTVHPRAD
jgi:hypothetical protein